MERPASYTRLERARYCAAVTAAEPARFVWVKVDVGAADAELISRIGHELRHALEVIEQPRYFEIFRIYASSLSFS